MYAHRSQGKSNTTQKWSFGTEIGRTISQAFDDASKAVAEAMYDDPYQSMGKNDPGASGKNPLTEPSLLNSTAAAYV